MSAYESTTDKSDRFRRARVLLGVDDLTTQQERMIGQTGDLATLPFGVETGLRARESRGVVRLGRDQTGSVHYLDVRDGLTVRVHRGGAVEHEQRLDEANSLPAWVRYVQQRRGWGAGAVAPEVLE